jgi:hypothetical protein
MSDAAAATGNPDRFAPRQPNRWPQRHRRLNPSHVPLPAQSWASVSMRSPEILAAVGHPGQLPDVFVGLSAHASAGINLLHLVSAGIRNRGRRNVAAESVDPQSGAATASRLWVGNRLAAKPTTGIPKYMVSVTPTISRLNLGSLAKPLEKRLVLRDVGNLDWSDNSVSC